MKLFLVAFFMLLGASFSVNADFALNHRLKECIREYPPQDPLVGVIASLFGQSSDDANVLHDKCATDAIYSHISKKMNYQ